MKMKFNERYLELLPEAKPKGVEINHFRGGLKKIPEKYNGKRVYTMNVAQNELKDLTNSPEIVDGHFSANNNELTSLAGAPQKADRMSIDNNENLGGLSGISDNTYKSFSCANCGLSDLSGLPKVTKFLDACSNPLKSLSGLERNKNYKGGIKLSGTGFTKEEIVAYCEKHGIEYGIIQD